MLRQRGHIRGGLHPEFYFMISCNYWLIIIVLNKYCLTFLFWFFIFLESSSSDNEEEAVISVLNMSQPADKSVRKKQGSLSNKPATVLAVLKTDSNQRSSNSCKSYLPMYKLTIQDLKISPKMALNFNLGQNFGSNHYLNN